MDFDGIISQLDRRWAETEPGDLGVNEELAHFALGQFHERRRRISGASPAIDDKIQPELRQWYWLGIDVEHYQHGRDFFWPTAVYPIYGEERIGEPAPGLTKTVKGVSGMIGSIQFHADGLGVLIGPITAGTDAAGNPTTIENVVVASADEAFVTVAAEGDKYRLKQVGPITAPGDPAADPPVDAQVIQVNITYDARSGEGEKPGADFIACTVVAGDAVSITVPIGAEERP